MDTGILRYTESVYLNIPVIKTKWLRLDRELTSPFLKTSIFELSNSAPSLEPCAV